MHIVAAMITEKDLSAYLDNLAIRHQTIEHPPMFTVEDGLSWHDKIPGLSCKNLFLKDKKDRLWLVVMPAMKRANLNRLEKVIGCARLSFGKPELLEEVLNIKPGSVTPFALMNATDKRLTVVLDEHMMQAQMVNFHPLRNTASTSLTSADLLKFIRSLGFSPLIEDCGLWIEDTV